MKRKIFTLLVAASFGVMAIAQDKPTASILKTSTAPVIDGTIDAIWAGATANQIDKPFKVEEASATAYWKATWDNNGIYVLISVTDDKLFNQLTGATDATYTLDKSEVYFDLIQEVDALGASAGNGKPDITGGIQQTAPDMAETFSIPATDLEGGRTWAYKCGATSVDEGAGNGSYVVEYFFPMSYFEKYPDFDKTNPMGFDISVSDNDGDGRNRLVWANIGGTDENWNNMDDAGTITLSEDPLPTAIKNSNLDKTSIMLKNDELVNVNGVANVYDMTGKLVLKGVANGTLNVSALKSGVYVVKANKTAKFVK